MNHIKVVAVSFVVVSAIAATPFVLGLWDLSLFSFFAPKYENVRREVFENTKSYREGMTQELRNMQFDYIQADDEHRAALKSLILHRAANVPEGALPQSLRDFLNELKETH